MAGRVYSTRFLAERTSSAATAASYLVPTGKVAVIRSVDIVAESTCTGLFGLVPASAYFFGFSLSGLLASYHWTGDQVAVAGERFGPQWMSGAFYVLASGFLLTA